MAEQTMNMAQARRMEHHQALRVWEPARQASPVLPHPHYTARRKQEKSNLVKHAVGTLLVLGALALMVNG